MGSGGMMKTPIILARSDRRSESSIMPGAISIMQRHPLSPREGVTSPGGLLPTPPEVPTKQRDDHSKVSSYYLLTYTDLLTHSEHQESALMGSVLVPVTTLHYNQVQEVVQRSAIVAG